MSSKEWYIIDYERHTRRTSRAERSRATTHQLLERSERRDLNSWSRERRWSQVPRIFDPVSFRCVDSKSSSLRSVTGCSFLYDYHSRSAPVACDSDYVFEFRFLCVWRLRKADATINVPIIRHAIERFIGMSSLACLHLAGNRIFFHAPDDRPMPRSSQLEIGNSFREFKRISKGPSYPLNLRLKRKSCWSISPVSNPPC